LSTEVESQYRILFDLRRIDEKILRLRHEKDRIPREIKTLEETLGAERDHFAKEEADLAESETILRDGERDLMTKETELSKAQEKMMGVKTNVEYSAAVRENEGRQKDKGLLEEKILDSMTELESARIRVKASEGKFKDYESAAKSSIDRLKEEELKLSELLKENDEKRSVISAKLEIQTSREYNLVAAGLGGVPIVIASNGLCSGCNMTLLPQMYNEILGFVRLHRCPTCTRILVVDFKDNAAETG